jgi:Tol biopolymer transport system component
MLSFSDASGGDTSTRSATEGAIYFILRSVSPPFDRQLAWADSDCIFSQASCQAYLIKGLPDAFDNQLHWSPDGRQAILIDSAGPRLLSFDPTSGTFSTLADNLLPTSDVALWSPDGTWIALTVENEQKDGSLITLIGLDQVSSLPDIQTLTAELAGIQMPLAWLDRNTLLFFRHSTQNKDGSGQFIEPGLYTLDLRRGLVSEMPMQGSWEWLKNYPAASPDGSKLVLWTELDGQRQLAVLDLSSSSLGSSQLTPLGVDGSNPVWSPNGDWIAFTTSGEDKAGQPTVAVNLIHPDGSGLQQIFVWGSTPSITWTPGSWRLVITAYPSGLGAENDLTAQYLVTLTNGRQQRILLEDAYQRYELIAPSFR